MGTKKFLGEGGNGFVWLARNSSKQEAAIKILAKINGKSKKIYARFKSEVKVVQGNSDIEGLACIAVMVATSRTECGIVNLA